MAQSYEALSHTSRGAIFDAPCGPVDLPVRPLDMRLRSGAPRLAAAESVLEHTLAVMIKHRRSRQKHFPGDLFADPAWDILLDLSLAELRQQRVSISSLCLGAQVPQSTGLRWIKHLTDNEMLVRRDDPLDARRKFVELSQETSIRMRAYIESLDATLAV